ncbi:MAG: hypothetical protein ACRCUE_02735, partial [Bosea sp. (in: a-proteobacteria)]
MSDRSETSSPEENAIMALFAQSDGAHASSGLYAATEAAGVTTSDIFAVGTSASLTYTSGSSSEFLFGMPRKPGVEYRHDMAMSDPSNSLSMGDDAVFALFAPVELAPSSEGLFVATEVAAAPAAGTFADGWGYRAEPTSGFDTCGCCGGWHAAAGNTGGPSDFVYG